MDEILMVRGDSSSIYEFSSKQVDILDDSWSGSWVVSSTLGSNPILKGKLVKNNDSFNDDSLINEEVRKSYRIFEPDVNDTIVFGVEMFNENTMNVTGTMFNSNKQPIPNKFAFITIKGLFVNSTRELRVKTDGSGNFTCIFDLDKTIKTPKNSFFIFQILPLESEKLLDSTYFVSVEVQQRDEQGKLIFRKEVLQSKLKIKQQGVI